MEEEFRVFDVEEVERRVAIIDAAKGDDEIAHSLEDRLWEDVLEHIAGNFGPEDPKHLAQAALRTRKIDFTRHRS